ncbi:MAG: lipid-A-disaccharide synthase [candidate division Zixibacteria bacterium]
MSDKKSIFICAGDPSADFPGKNLIEEIKRCDSNIDIFGLGGPIMQEAGLSSLADYKKLAVLGFWEIIPQVFFFRKLLKQAVIKIENSNPMAVILIDYPGFNLRLARRIKHLGIPIIYYISPQVWAWGKKRLAQIKYLVDLMLVIFPFEEEFYRRHQIPVKFVGHPIIDRYQDFPDAETCRDKLKIESGKKLIALLPGSRIQEVKRMLPVMIESAKRLSHYESHPEFIVAGVDNVPRSIYDNIISGSEIRMIIGQTPEIINAADLVITSSGTATVEIAYFGTPMVVIYKTGVLTFRIAKWLISLDSIAMVNIIAGRKIVPELIQDDASVANITREAISFLSDNEKYNRTVKDLNAVQIKLGEGDSGRRTVEAINEIISIC